MDKKNTLSSEDQARVDAYLSRPNHQIKRQPFRPWLLMGVIVLVMIGLSVFSYLFALFYGVI